MSLKHLNEAVFRENLNTKFAVDLGAQKIELELVEVSGDRSGLPKLEGYERFSLVLTGPGPLPQGTYAFEHEQLGPMEMFTVPVGQDDARTFRYEIIFSRFDE